MFNEEIKKLLIQVISSWQVWVVTIVLIIYIFLVNSVARLYRRRRPVYRKPLLPKEKPEISEKPASAISPSGPSSESDELELDEEGD